MGRPKARTVGQASNNAASGQRLRTLIGLHGEPKVTNSDRIGEVLGLKKDTQTKFNQQYDLNRPEVMRQLAMSGPEGQAILKEHWETLPPDQKERLVKEVVQAMPHPSSPTGISIDAQKIFQVLKTGKLDEASQAVIANAEAMRVPRQTRDGGGPRQKSGAAPVPEEQLADASVADPDAGLVSIAAPPGQYNMEAADDVRQPTRSQPLPRPVGFDPKEKGLKDRSGGTSIEDRPPLRAPNSRVEMVNGRPVRVVEEGSGAIGPEDMGAIKAGERYEAALDARAKMQLDLLVQTEGSQEAVANLFRLAGEGDQAAQNKIRAARTIAEKEVKVPPRPRLTEDFAARKSETSPQAIYDQNVNSLAIGKPGATVYTPKAGRVDHAMEIWKALATKFGKDGTPLGPQSVFDSPTQMAQFVLRNSSPEMFDVMPVTPKQRALAELGAVMKDLPLNAEKGRIAEAVKEYSPDAPLSSGDRNVVAKQAIERLARALEERFGSQWGSDYKPTRAGDTPAAPASTGGELGPGTTQDTSQIPGGGRISEPTDLSISDEEFGRRMDEYTRAVTSKGYMGEEVPYAAKPARPVKLDNSPPLNEAVIVDEKAGTARSFEQMLQDEIDKMYAGIDEGIAKDVADGKNPAAALDARGNGRSYSELDPEEQWKSGYATDPEDTNLAGQNARNPGTSPEDLARRDRMTDDLAETQPSLGAARQDDSLLGSEGGVDRTSLLLKRMDQVDAELQQLEVAFGSNRPEDAMDIQKYNDLTAEKANLKDRITIAQRIDSMTGVRSAKRGPPLGGRVGKGKAQEPNAQGGDPLDFVQLGADDAPVVETRPAPKPDVQPAPQPAAQAESQTATPVAPKAEVNPKVEPWLRDGQKRAKKVMKSLGAKKITEAKMKAAEAEFQEMLDFGKTLTGDAKRKWEAEVLLPLFRANDEARSRMQAAAAPKTGEAPKAAETTPPSSAADEYDLEDEPGPTYTTEDIVSGRADADDPGMDVPGDDAAESADVVIDSESPAVYPAPAVVRQPIDPEMIDPLESSATPIGDEPIDVEFEVKPDSTPKSDSTPDAASKEADPEATTLPAKRDAAKAAAKADAEKAPEDAESVRPDEEGARTEAENPDPTPNPRKGGILGGLWRHKGKATALGLAGLAGYQYLATQRTSDSMMDGSEGGLPGGGAGGAGGAGGPMGGGGQGGGTGVGDPSLWSPGMSSYERIRRLQQLDGTNNQKTSQTFYNWRGGI